MRASSFSWYHNNVDAKQKKNMTLILALSFWQSFYVFQILHRFFTVTSTKWRTLVFVIQKFAFWFYIKLGECSLSKLLACNTNTDNVQLYIFSLKLFLLFMLLCVFFRIHLLLVMSFPYHPYVWNHRLPEVFSICIWFVTSCDSQRGRMKKST